MPISEGLRTSLNQIRETSIQNNTLYAKQIDEITPTTDISSISSVLLDNDDLMNEFFKMLVKRIVYTQVVNYKLFNNPLKFLEGDRMPLGSIGQEIFINPARGRKFNAEDFAGLLAQYNADIKVQYPHLNSDLQYPVTITRAKIKDAFTSWSSLEAFIDGISQSLYNGAYIDRYNFTKGLVAQAYNDNNVIVQVVEQPTTQEQAQAFLTQARTIYLNMQEPTFNYNAWRQVGGYGRDILTWTDPDDIVFLLRNDIGAYLDVNVLAQTFNIDKAELLGRVKYVNDFSEYDKDGNIVVDGSKIIGMIADKAWFRIKNQEITMDEFYNANNRTWQMYLNDVNMFQYSLFSNAVVFATEAPTVTITGLDFKAPEGITMLEVGDEEGLEITTTPAQATTPEIEFTTDSDVFSVVKTGIKTCKLTALTKGTGTLTATAGNVTATVEVTVPTPTRAVNTRSTKNKQ